MNTLKLFMALLFIIGTILIITSFDAYGKIKDKCDSEKLRANLRMSVCIGTVMVVISIMFFICTSATGCNCNYNANDGAPFYIILFLLMAMGGFLLYLSISINSELKSDGCDIDIGVFPTILMVISILQIILPISYMFITNRNKTNKKNKKKKELDIADTVRSDSVKSDSVESDTVESDTVESDSIDNDDYEDNYAHVLTIKKLARDSTEIEGRMRQLSKEIDRKNRQLSNMKAKKKQTTEEKQAIKEIKSRIKRYEHILEEMTKKHDKIESELNSGGVSDRSDNTKNSLFT